MIFCDFAYINPKVSMQKGEVYPFIEMEDVTPGNRYIIAGKKREYKGGGSRFQSNDIIFARITPCLENGKIAQVKGKDGEKYFGSTEFFVFRAKEGISDSGFLFYLSYSNIIRKPAEKSMYGASGRQRAALDVIKSIEVPEISLSNQRKISSILSSYDDLIENNTRRIQILEEMAQLIYQEWFVNFRFPGHEKVRFVNSELGKIPEGWEVKSLEDIADLYRGKSYRSSDLQGNNCLPFFNLKNIQKGGGFRYEGTKLFSGKFSEEQTVRTGDILIAVTDMTQERNVVARVARVPKLKFDFGVFSMDLVRIEPKRGISKDWLYCMLRYSTFSDEVKEYANGVNVLHLSPDRIKEYRVLVPANGLQKQFGQIIKNIFLLIDNFYEKNENLKNARDILLPKLISGELDVSNLDIVTKEF